MRTVPRKLTDKLTFYGVHLAKWAENAEALGVSEDAIAELGAKLAATKAAYDAQCQAQQLAQVATARLKNAADELSVVGSSIIQQIRSTAATGGPGIYSLASIAGPSGPSPMAEPGTPRNLKYTLDAIGALHLKWSCRNPRGSTGTVYQVWRRIGFDGPLVYLAGVGGKEFVDATIPAGTARVTYKVQALRSTGVGQAAEFGVQFGGVDEAFAARANWAKVISRAA